MLCITDHNAIAGARRARRPAAVPGDRRRGAAHGTPARSSACSSPSGCRVGLGHVEAATAHPRPGRARVHPAPVRPDAAQPRRTGAARTRRARPGRRGRGAQREDVVARASTARARDVRRRVRPRRAAPAATPTSPMRSGRRTSRCPTSTTAAEFLAALRAGVVVGHHWDEAASVVRPHRPVVLIGLGLTPSVPGPNRPNADQCAAQVRRLFTRSPGTSGHGRMRTLARPSWAAAATGRGIALRHGDLDDFVADRHDGRLVAHNHPVGAHLRSSNRRRRCGRAGRPVPTTTVPGAARPAGPAAVATSAPTRISPVVRRWRATASSGSSVTAAGGTSATGTVGCGRPYRFAGRDIVRASTHTSWVVPHERRSASSRAM